MIKVWAIAQNTFREAVRDRILHSIIFFAFGVILLSLVLKEVTIGEQDKVVRSIAQSSIDIFASIMAMFLGISTIGKELENKTIYTLLSKPIGRAHFLLGKYCGIILTILAEVILLALFYTLLIGLEQGFPEPIFFASLVLVMIEMMLITACSVLCASYSSRTTASAFVLAIFVIGHLADDIWLFASEAKSPMFQQLGQTLYYLLPNFEALSIRTQSIHNESIPFVEMLYSIGYGVSYTTVVLIGAITLFRRRDIQ